MLRAARARYRAGMDTPFAVPSRSPARLPQTVFLVEDSAVVRDRLLKMLRAIPEVSVLGTAESPAEAIAQIRAEPPALLILDIKLKGGSGIEVLQAVRAACPDTTVVMLTNYATPIYRDRCLEIGADYFLDKTNEFQRIASILMHLKGTARKDLPC